ncbi:MAG: dihydroorotase [Bacteroidia bacterium]
MKLLILNAQVCDSKSDYNGKICDILVKDGLIEDIQTSSKKAFASVSKSYQVLDAEKSMISNAWLDLRADFCDPGHEERETLQTGARAALAGGFGSVAILPSTDPACDKKTGIEYVCAQNKQLPIHVFPYGCISQNKEGKELAELYDMFQAGAVGFTDGNRPVNHAGLQLRALLYSKIFNGLILSSPDEPTISAGGKMHEGETSTYLGMKGIPAIAEEIRIMRDLELAKYSGAGIHFSHLSTKGAVELIRKAKRAGVQVTCDVAIANLCFTDEVLNDYNSNFKVYPPLRGKSDQKALWDGIADGTIDAIISNHQPHNQENKTVEFEYAHIGMNTLETVWPMLVKSKPKNIEWNQIIPALTSQPASILKQNISGINIGAQSEFTIFNPTKTWVYNKKQSKSTNSPLFNQTLTGKVIAVYVKDQLFIN